MLLTGCFGQSISKEKMLTQIDNARTATAVDSSKIDNVKIHNKLSIDSYNYKAGEFYAHRYFALALIVPISYGEYTWKEDGKYYHAHKELTKDLVTKEIDEVLFNQYMEDHRLTISQKLRSPLDSVQNLIEGKDDTYTVESNKFTYTALSKEYKSATKVSFQTTDPDNSEQQITREKTFTLVLKNSLPKTYTIKENWEKGSEEKWTYSYGNAEFNNPSGNTSESN